MTDTLAWFDMKAGLCKLDLDSAALDGTSPQTLDKNSSWLDRLQTLLNSSITILSDCLLALQHKGSSVECNLSVQGYATPSNIQHRQTFLQRLHFTFRPLSPAAPTNPPGPCVPWKQPHDGEITIVSIHPSIHPVRPLCSCINRW